MKEAIIMLIIIAGNLVTATDLENRDRQIGDQIGQGITPEEIVISQNIKVYNQGGESTLTFTEEGDYAKIKNDLFMNIKKQDANTNAYIKLNDKGEVTEADITSDQQGSYTFGNETVQILAGTRITYNNGEINVHGKGAFFMLSHTDDKTTPPQFIRILDGDEIKIKGNTLTGKNLEINGVKVVSLKEGGGEVTFSGNKVVKVGKETSTSINGVDHHVFSKELNLYYEDKFDPSQHIGENYFNYGRNKASMAGSEFMSVFREENDVFPELKLTKDVRGRETKVGYFAVNMLGGNVDIADDLSKKEPYFNLKSEGDFSLSQGRTKVTAEGGEIYFQPNKEFELSYGMNINNLYFSDGYLLEDKDEGVILDTYFPWERTIQKTGSIDTDQVNQAKQAVKKQLNVNPKVYYGFINDEREEDLAKWIYQATEKANMNKYNIKVTPYEVFTTFMAEGGADTEGIIQKYYYDDHYTKVLAFADLGLDYITKEMPMLKKDGFVPEDTTLTPKTATNEHGIKVPTANFKDLGDGLTALAGRMAWTKKVFLDDFKSYYGEDELRKLSDDEKFFWTEFYYNCGNSCGKGELTGTTYTSGRGVTTQGKGRTKLYKPWESSTLTSNTNPRYNSLERLASKKLLEDLRVFETP